jgi:hypothetical protein
MKTSRKFRFTTLFITTIASISFTDAATISWTVNNITGNFSDISTAGTLVSTAAGVALGGAGVTGASVTVNGVQFLDNATIVSPTNNDGIGARTGLPTSGPLVAYHTLLDNYDRSTAASNQTISLTALTVDQVYQFQVWIADNSNVVLTTGIVFNDGTATAPNPATSGHATLLAEVTEAGSGQYAIGTFTANTTTQNILLRRYTGLPTTPAAATNTFANAWQLRAIPEPSSALLGAIGSLALLRRRRA